MDGIILHQDDVETVVRNILSEGQRPAIEDLEAPSPTYVESDAISLTNAVNAILAIFREKGFIDT